MYIVTLTFLIGCLHLQTLLTGVTNKVEIFLEQGEVVFLSPNLNFSTEIQIFANFAG